MATDSKMLVIYVYSGKYGIYPNFDNLNILLAYELVILNEYIKMNTDMLFHLNIFQSEKLFHLKTLI